MDDLLAALGRHFGHTSFRAGQRQLVEAVIDGRDVLAVMPTGSGKSLGFQLPAMLLPGTTLVISPLISLMKDQVDELTRRGIRAAALHSMLSEDARRGALAAADAGALSLLYVAPERFASEHFVRRLQGWRVARFVVDEAHCLSEWGHDFRPDYRRLRGAAAECRRSDGRPGRPPIAAFTATATPEVRDDVTELLGLDSPSLVVAGFDRPNIELRVVAVSGEHDKRRLLPKLVGAGRAIVYASTRRKAEIAADTLRETGIPAQAYHAGIADEERVRVQDAFAAGNARVICATNAFGMGIDRPDVEAVVHVDVPGSVEAYYQEIGRAGRDGRPASATLLWNYADVKTREFLIDRTREEAPEARGLATDPTEIERRKTIERAKLRRMVAYADGAACLRATILRYFGDPAAHDPCDACSVCARRAPVDATVRLLIRKVLSGVARAGERFGRRKIAAMLVGDLDGLPDALVSLSTTGLLRDESPRVVEQWIDAAEGAGLLRASSDQYRTLSLTTSGRDVMAGRVEQFTIAPPAPRAAPSSKKRAARSAGGRTRNVGSHAGRKADLREAHEARSIDVSDESVAVVFQALRQWRIGEARRRGIAPFVILHDRTIRDIATQLPRSIDELAGVSGIGPAKLASYGDIILSTIQGAIDPAASSS